MKINYNIPALKTLNQLNKVNDKGTKAMQRLSSGLKIISAADDGAGMAIANKLDAQVKALQQANRNAMDGISMLQTAEGACNEVHAMLQRIRELTVQAANGTNAPEDTANIEKEVGELIKEMRAIQDRTEFNQKKLLAGSENQYMFQVGANANEMIKVDGEDMNLDSMLQKLTGETDLTVIDEDTFTYRFNLSSKEEATKALARVEEAVEEVSNIRGKIGAYQNRLEHTVNSLGVSEENMTGSLSRIQDADMALEMASYTQYNILSQAATSMLAQANQRPQQVLQLLK